MLEEFVDLDAVRLGRALRRTRILAVAIGRGRARRRHPLGYPAGRARHRHRALPRGAQHALGGHLGGPPEEHWWREGGTSSPRDAHPRRLGVTTAVVLALLFLVTPMGFGALGGPRSLYQAASCRA